MEMEFPFPWDNNQICMEHNTSYDNNQVYGITELWHHQVYQDVSQQYGQLHKAFDVVWLSLKNTAYNY